MDRATWHASPTLFTLGISGPAPRPESSPRAHIDRCRGAGRESQLHIGLIVGGYNMATAESPATPGQLLSERIAPGILPKVLGPFDMVAIFVAIVLFANQGSVIQAAGPAGFVYWILGFVTFLIPGAIVTGQLGLMFPGEGSIYAWTHNALGNFWGFFSGLCAWWPGILVMVATADLIVTMLQFLNSSWLQQPWQQGVVIMLVIWISTVLSILRFRVTQNLV